MKSMKKLVSAVIAVSLAGTMLLSGCGKEIEAKAVASALYKLVLHADDKEAKEIGFTDAEVKTLTDKQKSTSKMTYKQAFISNGLTMSDKEAEDLYNAEMSVLKKLKFDVEVKDKKGKTCTVVIKTDTANVTKVIEDATNATVARVEKEKETNKTKIAKMYLEEIQKAFDKVEISTDKKEMSAAFELQKVKTKDGNVKMWVPKDAAKFGEDLVSTVEQ